MEKTLSYEAANGQQVTIDYLEEICSEIGYLLHGSIITLNELSSADEISDEQCARLMLSLNALKYVANRLDSIFPSAITC